MTESRMRWGSAFLLVFVATGLAIWQGEDLRSVIPIGVIVLALGGGLLGYAIAPYPAVAGGLSCASLIVLCVLGGWYLGRTIATSAFDDCVARGETVRDALVQYQRTMESSRMI